MLHQTEKLLRRVLGSFIRLEVQSDPATPPILADPSQMDQVLLNLALNARDAMPDGGTLTLTLAGWERAAHDPLRYAAVPLGEYCRLAVKDTGVGMDSTTIERIFEPFFTTKDVGKGTGLGLATCYGIVTNAGGHLFVSSKNKGTEFEIILPAAPAQNSARSASETASSEGLPPRPHLQAA